MMPTHPHGGQRPGAGRKKGGTVQMVAHPKRDTERAILAHAKQHKRTIGQVLDLLVARCQRPPAPGGKP